MNTEITATKDETGVLRMQLYSIVSIVIILLSTASLFIIFRQKNLKDIRYQLGLIASAVISLISGLVFPRLVSTISSNLALQLFISVFLSLLLYILILFLVLMLVSMLIPKEKADKLIQEWEEKKKSIQNAIEARKKEKEAAAAMRKENAAKAPAPQNEPTVQQPSAMETVKFTPDIETTAASADLESEGPVQEPPIEEIKSVPEVERTMTSTEAVNESPVKEPLLKEIELTPAVEIAAASASAESESPIQEFLPTEATTPSHPESDETIAEPQANPITAQQDRIEEINTATEQDNAAGTDDEIHGAINLPGEEAGSETDLFDDAALLLENSLEKNENDEKNVDTSDIIDKMGIDMIPERAYPISDQGQSLNEIIDKAFQLKQQGNEIEAAALYMIALDKNPDNETAFWIVLDICAIYKATGHADLAEDILLTYIDTFDDMMSEEVKDQILLSLYNN